MTFQQLAEADDGWKDIVRSLQGEQRECCPDESWPERDPASLAKAFSFVLKNGGAKHPIGPYYTPAAAWVTSFRCVSPLGTSLPVTEFYHKANAL